MKKLVVLGIALISLSCDDIVGVEDISSETVTILAPTDGTILTNRSITFTWNGVVDAEQYTVQIAVPAFENAAQIVIDSTMTTTNFTTILDYNSYEWRVKAKNSEYETNYTTQSFTVEE